MMETDKRLSIENPELDKKLQDGGVKFLPWIGKNYENGMFYDNDGKLILGTEEKLGKKVLVLGESHYIEDYDPEVDITHFTRDVIENYLSPNTHFERWMNTFTKFIRALAGEEIDRGEQATNIYNHIAFYNYLQVPVTGPRIVGEDDDYEGSQGAFFQLLEQIKPNVVIIWGYRLWEYLPDDYEFEWVSEYYEGDEIHRSGSYKINGKTILLLPIRHPSVVFSWDYWNRVIINLF